MTVIDAAAHPMMRRDDDIRAHLVEPFFSRRFPNPDRYYYPAPESDYAQFAWPEGAPPASDPKLVAEHLFGDFGIDQAILLPLTRGIMPDLDLGTVICRATNDWLAETWLGAGDGRFKGTIRLNPGDPVEAVKEIARWRGSPHIVQVAVPLEAHKPYGHRDFFPIWTAAIEAGFAVAIHADGGTGVELFPSPVGYFHHYVEYTSFLPYNGFYHLASFIAEGVFERLPDLRVVFADGMGDIAGPLLWRMDETWRATRDRTPWVRRSPLDYIRSNVRYVAHGTEGPTDEAVRADYWRVSDVADVQLYGSNYPSWDLLRPADAVSGIDETQAARFLGGNAAEWYRLGAGAPA